MGLAGVLTWLGWRLALLAQQGRFSPVGRQSRRGGAAIDATDLVLLIVLVVALAVAAWLLARYFRLRQGVAHNSPRRLFQELGQAHGLDRSSLGLLLRLAHWHQLGQPARLFLEPERFDAPLDDAMTQPQREQLRKIREIIFREVAGD